MDVARTGATRREFVAGIGLLATAGAALADGVARAAAQATRAAAGSGDPAALARLERFVRLRSSPGHVPVMWIADGLLLGKPVGGPAQPLLRNTIVSFTQVAPRAGGAFDFRLEEVGYFRALDSDEVLAEWGNPVTGRRVRPRHYRTPEALRLRPEGPAIAAAPAGLEFRGVLGTLAELAGTVTLSEDLYVRIPGVAASAASATQPARAARAERFLASLGSYTGRVAAVPGPFTDWVDCSFHYSTLNSFSDWLGFDGVDGTQSLRLAGVKRPHDDLDAIPGWLRERVMREHASFLEVPRRWLADGWLDASRTGATEAR